MPTIYLIKPAFQNFLRPLVRFLYSHGVTANQVTVAGCLLSIVYGLILFNHPENSWVLMILPGVLFLRMAFNAIDGMLAREFHMSSALGAILNELTDVVSDVALYLPFARVSGFSAPLVVIIVILAIMSEMMGVVCIQIGAKRGYEGPMGKSDRAAVFGILALLLGLGVPDGFWINIVLWGTLCLLIWTLVNRAKGALKQVGDQ